MTTVQFNEIDYDKINNASMMKIAALITAQAKLFTHVQTGALRNSEMWKFQTEEGGFNDSPGETAKDKIEVPSDKSAYVGVKIMYGPYEEFGTRYMAPHPYMRPAILIYTGQRGVKEVIEMINAEMKLGALKPGQIRVFD
jgi:HK97 gp10 family phage protein